MTLKTTPEWVSSDQKLNPLDCRAPMKRLVCCKRVTERPAGRKQTVKRRCKKLKQLNCEEAISENISCLITHCFIFVEMFFCFKKSAKTFPEGFKFCLSSFWLKIKLGQIDFRFSRFFEISSVPVWSSKTGLIRFLARIDFSNFERRFRLKLFCRYVTRLGYQTRPKKLQRIISFSNL